jgi:hypothetical protein
MWPYGIFLATCCAALFFVRGKVVPGRKSAPISPASHDALREREQQAQQARTRAQQRIARELCAGQLSLWEAAERFQELNEAGADFDWQAFRNAFPGGTNEERHCRQVLAVAYAEAASELRERDVLTPR